MPVIFRALAHRNYRLYFIGQFVSLSGTWMQQVALLWMTYRLTDSTVMLGVVTFATQAPLLVLAPVGGLLSDRMERRVLLLWTQWLSLAHAALLAILTFTLPMQPWYLVFMALLFGLINAIDQPVRQSFIAELIDNHEDISNAVALTSFTIHSSRFVGPALGGVVVAFAGEGVCFLINAVSYLATIIALLMIHPRTIARLHHSLLDSLRSGFRYAFEQERIRVLLFMVATIAFFGAAHVTLLPWFAREIYSGGAESFGFLSAAVGVGACLGTLYLASHKTAAAIDRNIGKAVLIAGVTVILFAFTDVFALAVLELIVIGFCSINIVASSNALIQQRVNDEMRGRVMAIFTMAFFGISPLGSLAVGYASSIIGARTTLVACALVVLAMGMLSANVRKQHRVASP